MRLAPVDWTIILIYFGFVLGIGLQGVPGLVHSLQHPALGGRGAGLHHAPLTRFNVNLYWGLGLLVFGAVMLALGFRAQARK